MTMELGELTDIGVKPRGGAHSAGLEYALGRNLSENDLELLKRPQGITTQPLEKLRESHHMLARLVAKGLKQVEISAITGFSQSRISILKNDPSFKELIAHYHEVEESAFADVSKMLAALSVDAIAELRERILDTPESFSNAQMLNALAMLLDRTGHGPSAKLETTHSHSIDDDTLGKLKQLVRGAQNGTITARTIEGRASKERTPAHSGAPISLLVQPRAELCEAETQGVQGQG